MTDTITVELRVNIPKTTYDALLRLTRAQNASLGNNVSRLLNLGIDSVYAKHPRLKGEAHD